MSGRANLGLVVSLPPGIDLLGLAFEREGFCVVHGPDLLWGRDMRDFHPPPGVFAGVIGGPPCQQFSRANAINGSPGTDLIPEFVRVVNEARPAFVVMENVEGARHSRDIPDEWFPAVLRDYDCGGETYRKRYFWTWPFALLQPSRRRDGVPSYSVLATTGRRGRGLSVATQDRVSLLPGNLPLAEYERLQGVEGITGELMRCRSSKAFAIHVLGNGVPMAMGSFVARSVALSVTR